MDKEELSSSWAILKRLLPVVIWGLFFCVVICSFYMSYDMKISREFGFMFGLFARYLGYFLFAVVIMILLKILSVLKEIDLRMKLIEESMQELKKRIDVYPFADEDNIDLQRFADEWALAAQEAGRARQE